MVSPNVSIGEPNELGWWGLSTPWSVTSSTASFRTLGAFDWRVPYLLLRRDGERCWWKSVKKIGWLLMIQTLWRQRLRSALSSRRQLLRQSTCTYLFANIPFDINNWRLAHSSPQSSGRVFTRPANYTCLASVVNSYHYGLRSSINLPLHWSTRKRGWVRVLMRCTVDLPAFELNWTRHLLCTLS